MTRSIAFLTLTSMLLFSSCSKKESAEAPQPSTQPPATAELASGPHAFVHLQDGSKIPGSIVASTQTDMVEAGDDGIERRIPLTQVKTVEYGEARPAGPARQTAVSKRPARNEPAQPQQQAPQETAQTAQPSATAPAPQGPITAK